MVNVARRVIITGPVNVLFDACLMIAWWQGCFFAFGRRLIATSSLLGTRSIYQQSTDWLLESIVQ